MADTDLLDRVRKLLAKAEADGCTDHERDALNAKAAELMAAYGIDRALLGALRPETDQPTDKIIEIDNPWARVKAHMLAGIVAAMRGSVILLNADTGARLHVFGYTSDIERADMMYTSMLLQMNLEMAHQQLAQLVSGKSAGRAWNRSFLLGFASAVVARIKAAEARATGDAEQERSAGMSTALVLADRQTVVNARVSAAYPRTRKTRVTYSGQGYRDGHAAGQRADIGQPRAGSGGQRQLGR